jgi:hypothetical protein
MKFIVQATQIVKLEITVEREFEIEIKKKQVVDRDLCANVVDGDPDAWRESVDEYIDEVGIEKLMRSKKVNISLPDWKSDMQQEFKKSIARAESQGLELDYKVVREFIDDVDY